MTPLTSSRATALLLDLFVRLPAGRVVVPVNVCPLVPWAVRQAGHAPVFRDIDPLRLDIHVDIGQAEPPPVAVVYVRPYGADLPRLDMFAAWRAVWPDVLIVDDACLGIPELNVQSGSHGADVTLFSTGPSKVVSLGVGGYAWCSARVRRLFSTPPRVGLDDVLRSDHHRWSREGPIVETVDRLTPGPEWPEYAARISHASRARQAHRDTLNQIYEEAFPCDVQLPSSYQRWRFNIRVTDPDAARAVLTRHHLFASRHFAPLVPDRQRFPHAWTLHDGLLNLWNDSAYSADFARRTCQLLQPFLAWRK